MSRTSCVWTVAWPLAQRLSFWPIGELTPRILCIHVHVERILSTSPSSFIIGVPMGWEVFLYPQHQFYQRSLLLVSLSQLQQRLESQRLQKPQYLRRAQQNLLPQVPTAASCAAVNLARHYSLPGTNVLYTD